jgi:hypothetical protein
MAEKQLPGGTFINFLNDKTLSCGTAAMPKPRNLRGELREVEPAKPHNSLSSAPCIARRSLRRRRAALTIPKGEETKPKQTNLGLTSLIPVGVASKPEQTWFFCEKPLCFVFSGPSQNKFCSVIQKQNHTDGTVSVVCSGFGGERGIRTPGPAIAGQRFSRPPH